MSVFIVSHSHVDALLNFAKWNDRTFDVPTEELSEEGRLLMAANIASFCDRYREHPAAHALEAAYRFTPPKRRLSPVEALKACECFDCQAGQWEGYANSPAANLVECIRKVAISRLPGYGDAAWEVQG